MHRAVDTVSISLTAIPPASHHTPTRFLHAKVQTNTFLVSKLPPKINASGLTRDDTQRGNRFPTASGTEDQEESVLRRCSTAELISLRMNPSNASYQAIDVNHSSP